MVGGGPGLYTWEQARRFFSPQEPAVQPDFRRPSFPLALPFRPSRPDSCFTLPF